jgi:hypothetical protein
MPKLELRGNSTRWRAGRILDDLNEQVVAFAHQLADVGQLVFVHIGLVPVARNVGHVQECRPVQPDLYKSRLHPGQHARNRAIVDIADQAPACSSLNEYLLQHAIFEQCCPNLGWCHIDQDLFFT